MIVNFLNEASNSNTRVVYRPFLPLRLRNGYGGERRRGRQ